MGRSSRRSATIAGTLCLGAFLNPFNSSMLAVALVTLRGEFHLSIQGVTWVITAFYIASAVAQPLMGRLGDRFGPRRMFIGGMWAVVAGSVLAASSSTWAVLCFARVVTAIGSATSFPSAVAIVRRHADRHHENSTRQLARLQLASNVGSALGPVAGGLLLTFAGWRGIFVACIPVAAAAIVGTSTFIDRDPARETVRWRAIVVQSDLFGVIFFVVSLSSGILAVVGGSPVGALPLAVISVTSLTAFFWRELTFEWPFIDVRILARNAALMRVYAAFVLFCVFYYAIVFGLPQFLEDSVGLSTSVVGVAMFPLAVTSALVNSLVSRCLERWGVKAVVTTGVIMSMLASVVCLVTVRQQSVLVSGCSAALVGLASGFVTVGTAQGMFLAARPEQVGVAAGLLQTSRYVGAIGAMGAIAVIFGHGVDAPNWAMILLLSLAVCAAALLITRNWRPSTTA